LLLGRHFIIETDHANLLYMDIAKAPKVVRWRLRLSAHNFEIRHIAGKLNIVADGLSRLLAMRHAQFQVKQHHGRAPPRPMALASYLPPGWRHEVVVQQGGKGAGKATNTFYGPDGTKFSSADACWKEMFRLGLHNATVPSVSGTPLPLAPPVEPVFDVNVPDDEYDFDVDTAAGRIAALRHVHCDIAGHMRKVETTRRLDSMGLSWPGYATQVREFISACPTCQKTDVNRKVPPRAQRAWTPPTRPGEVLAVDLIGPVGDSKPVVKGEPKRPKTYILVMVDVFTRHVELECVQSKKAEVISIALLRYVSRYGLPEYMRSDGGGEFTAQVIDDLLTFCGTERQLVLPYLSRGNGIVERVNKEVIRHVRGFVQDRKDRSGWASYLPLVQRILNSNKHESTGYTPHQIMFGPESTLDRGLVGLTQKRSLRAKGSPSASTPGITEHMARALADRRQVNASAAVVNRQTLAARQNRKSIGPMSLFDTGDYVMMTYPKDSKPRGKIGAVWRGPYRILRRKESNDPSVKSNRFLVEHMASGAEMIVSDSTLVPYVHGVEDPRVVASADHNEWVVERIIGHRYEPALAPGAKLNTAVARKKLQLLCRWLGYGPLDDDWITYRGNKDLEAITAYSSLHPELGLD
jgi:hypothetical protein